MVSQAMIQSCAIMQEKQELPRLDSTAASSSTLPIEEPASLPRLELFASPLPAYTRHEATRTQPIASPPYTEVALPGEIELIAASPCSAYGRSPRRISLPTGQPIIAIPGTSHCATSPLLRAFPPSLASKYSIPREKWFEFLDATSAFLTLQTPLKMLDDLAHTYSALGKHPINPLTRKAARGVESTVVRNILIRHLASWNRDYFSEKSLKVFLVTGAMLDRLAGPSSLASSTQKVVDWEQYSTQTKARALDPAWVEIERLVKERPIQCQEAGSLRAERNVRSQAVGMASYASRRLAGLEGYIECLDGDHRTNYAERYAAPVAGDNGGSSAIVTDRPALRPLASSGSHSSGGSNIEKRESQKVIKAEIKEAVLRASCIWLVALPLA